MTATGGTTTAMASMATGDRTTVTGGIMATARSSRATGGATTATGDMTSKAEGQWQRVATVGMTTAMGGRAMATDGTKAGGTTTAQFHAPSIFKTTIIFLSHQRISTPHTLIRTEPAHVIYVSKTLSTYFEF